MNHGGQEGTENGCCFCRIRCDPFHPDDPYPRFVGGARFGASSQPTRLNGQRPRSVSKIETGHRSPANPTLGVFMRVPTHPALRRWSTTVAMAGLFAGQPAILYAQTHITSPKEQFGFNIGDDYKLAHYTQFEQYWRMLATQSNRMKLVEIGKSAEGRPQLMAIISSPANLQKLERYKEISRKLALAEGL